ncbi:cation diffusion facilitator family transporter [Rhizobium leguminosarum]|uniref:cation diffusion facilitator family transporter n=1 Tax=Rhizobium leguminosarum TaxID=384 RepID=UPI00103944F9|nr:cation diffusion facilitator family transporter [Rhizobium leguminosarum]MBB4331637.1 cation diffusion facilitator family transporter [Rhizobium leguminosarum]MBB4357084.1 cation diffusion facilitator family transporter [Rhizobium leguminosarum]MBB4551644.1 cation diffusion facilitator family transporter [Rhizobium leguminosarum]MBB4564237.1 cation diffusion facilitator family transporter [Rhizobium leguminosarum]TBZ57174.1 cation transporter [Rhizobium leguminosarum bv. viciae]
MVASIKEWFGFGQAGHAHGHNHGSHAHSHGDASGHGHTHGVIDPSIAASERGIWAIKWSFVILAITAALQLVVVFTSGSVALLADTIHNVGDAATAIPLWIAFTLVRRKPTATFNYGLGRVEDLAGMLIVLIILFSALVAGYEATDRLMNPQPITQLLAVAVAGIVGFIGNEAVAVFRIRVGRQMNSAALIADGYHARTDGLTSLAVVLGAVGVWLGFPLADPIIGLLITIAIFGIVWQSARAVITRSLDGVEPGVTDEIRHAADHVAGIDGLTDVKARWIGHKLHADVTISVSGDKRVADASAIVATLRNELQAHLPALGTATIQIAEAAAEALTSHRGHGHHHAPAPFTVSSPLATGLLEIVDTPEGERMRLSISKHARGLEAVVEIARDGVVERLPLLPSPADHHALISNVAPAEPHEFDAVLKLMAGVDVDDLPFRMEEPEGHHH